MPVTIGKVVALTGRFFARDEKGVARELHEGDEVYTTDTLSSNDGSTAEITIALADGGIVQLDGGSKHSLADTSSPIDVQEELPASEQPSNDVPTTDAVGYEATFSERSGEIVDVKTKLHDSVFFHIDPIEKKENGTNQDSGSAKPAPILTINGGEVQDNYYDSVGASGTNIVTNTMTFETVAGFKTVQIGSHSFDQNALQSLNTTPVTLAMTAGELTLKGYTQAGNTYTIAYQYETADNFHHDPTSDTFVDSLSVVVTASDGQADSSILSIDVIDDLPTSEGDTNVIQEGLVADQISGNVFLDTDHGIFNHGGSLGDRHYADVADHLGADDTTINAPVVGVTSGSDTSHPVTGNISTNVAGLYGDLVLNADGSYDYHLDNTNPDVKVIVDGEVIHDVFTYTIADDDGDLVATTLDITIAGNSQGPHIVAQPGTVEEAALAIGTTPSSPNEIVTGQIVGTSNNGFDHLDLQATNGNILTIWTLSNIDGSQTLTTPQGTLTLVNYTNTSDPNSPGGLIHTIDYSYELTSPYNNQIASDHFDDLISLTVTDAAGSITIENLVITITDDAPTAVADTNDVTEDTMITVSDNVFDSSDNTQDDIPGADRTTTPIIGVVQGTPPSASGNVGSDVAGSYGKVNIAADGSYTYTLDNTLPAVQALNNADTLTDTFTYTMTDADGDTSTTTLTITVNGNNNDVPTLAVTPVDVYEHGLVDGSSPDNSDIVSGTFTITAIDGLKEITVEGTTITEATLLNTGTSPETITTGLGNEIQIEGYDPLTGIVNYTYTLLDNENHDKPTHDTILDEPITITVTDTDTSGSTNSVTNDLIVHIHDDVPTANPDKNSVTV
ncbi:MAG: VCBS domain-containing protein, partial [Deltaproteobacteria bacterium]|nr:VCBS domain-containing protein [Deltaproteobacteria bacterium]